MTTDRRSHDVAVISASRGHIPWTVVQVESGLTFVQLFENIVAGAHPNAFVGCSIQVEGAYSESDVEHFWEILQLVESSLTSQDTSRDKVKDMQDLQAFFNHCCQMRHYSFFKKICGDNSCIICKPVKMDKEEFKKLHFFPDPLIQDDGHYVPFKKVFTQTTIEKDCSSLRGKSKVYKLFPSALVYNMRRTLIL